MDINLDLYKVFREVARAGNISRAAEKLFISQSAVSQAVMQLENRIGGRLFNRSVRGVTMTVEGEILFSHIDEAIRLIENAQARFEEMKELSSGSVRIGASDTICSLYLLPVLERFNRIYPDIRISVTNRVTQESIGLLKQAAVDIAFVNLPIDNDDALDITSVMAIHDSFVVGGQYAHLADKAMNFSDLTRYPIMMLEKASNTRNQMDLFLASKGIDVSPAIELGSLSLLSGFARIGLGIAATIREDVQHMLDRNELRELIFHEELPKRHIGLLRMKSKNLSFAARAFIDEMAKVI